MKVLLTGTTGYVGQRLLPLLLEDGHEVTCCVRDPNRFAPEKYTGKKFETVTVDLLDPGTLHNIPADIDVAYYLVHSMSASIGSFDVLEERAARNFRERMEATSVRQVIYLGGIVNEEKLSRHLVSRRNVEKVLASDVYGLTTLRAGIIIGSGSASFEIMRDLVEKLPVMIAPKWLSTRSQPIAVRTVLEYLKAVLMKPWAMGNIYDIGGPDVLTYKEMLQLFAGVRGLRRTIVSIPVMTPKLSSYWLYFVTSTSYKLAVNLVESMKVEVVCREHGLDEKLGIQSVPYVAALRMAFREIELQDVASSWTDAQSSHVLERGITVLGEVPSYGCFKDSRRMKVEDELLVQERVWSIGGEKGWYYADWLWTVRGWLDKLVGGAGLQRGRKDPVRLAPGDALDFWRVLIADKPGKCLLLYAEMKLPGEAWLQFEIRDGYLVQTATFRPLGLLGRLYWYLAFPLHAFVFAGMLRKLALTDRKD